MGEVSGSIDMDNTRGQHVRRLVVYGTYTGCCHVISGKMIRLRRGLRRKLEPTAEPDSSRASRNACSRNGLTSPDPLAHASHSLACTCIDSKRCRDALPFCVGKIARVAPQAARLLEGLSRRLHSKGYLVARGDCSDRIQRNLPL